ncbi:MAG: hypothetical protein JST69_05350 [Bacteroidetes bacterium]|nr:hypothetical protein [Bacteroidota bacterium]
MRAFLIACLVAVNTTGFAQQLILHTTSRVEAWPQQPVSIRLEATQLKKYTVTMQGQPTGSVLEGERFRWTPQAGDKPYYFVTFLLLDSLGKQKDEATLELLVKPQRKNPSIEFDRRLPDTISVEENQPFLLSAQLKSNAPSNQPTTPYFLFNENVNLRSFDSCRIEQMGDQLVLQWVPSNAEAQKRYAKLRITLVGADSAVSTRVLTFKIKDIDTPPSFRYTLPDTLFTEPGKETVLDFTADDDDHKKLHYDYHPKSNRYRITGSKIIFNAINPDDYVREVKPMMLSVRVSDEAHQIEKNVWIVPPKKHRTVVVGDFTKKEFEEGDSVVTFLNVSGDNLDKYDFRFSDLALPPGIGSLANKLELQKYSAFIKVKSKGVLPYNLVDREYTFNLALSVTEKSDAGKTVYKILELSVKDRPDPTNLGQQKDSLLTTVQKFLKTEMLYKNTLEKMQAQINRPWWKKAAVITGALSGIIGLVQSQEQNKSISALAAVISLASITVTNLPSLTEKTLSELTDNIANSKGRIDQLQESESVFRSTWSADIDRATFYKLKTDITDKLTKGRIKRGEDVCSLWKNKTLKRKIVQLLKSNFAHEKSNADMKTIFQCADEK